MKKGCAEIKMWGKCGVQIAKMWCLGLVLNNPFCGAKFSKFGVKIMVFGCQGMLRANKLGPTGPNII